MHFLPVSATSCTSCETINYTNIRQRPSALQYSLTYAKIKKKKKNCLNDKIPNK